jgi:putative peptidoglycan lipid II flippase
VIVAIGTLSSRGLGLIRDALAARYIAPEARDAFVVAFRLTNIFRRVLCEGAFSASLVPALAELQARGEEAEARAMASAAFAALMAVAVAGSFLGILFMDPALRLMLGGEPFALVPGKLELAILLSRIMFGFLALAALFAYFMAALHAVGRFALAALAPVLFNSAMIVAAVARPAGGRSSEALAEALAWAVLVGGALQALVLAPAVWRGGLWPRLRLARWSPRAGRAIGAAVPVAVGSSLLQMTGFANIWFAARLPQGSHSYLDLADRILELPLTLFAVSLGSAILPDLAREWAMGRPAGVGQAMSRALRAGLFIMAPSAVGMVALAEPIVDGLFVGREFGYREAAQTAQLIQIYGLALLVAGGARILAQGLYAARLARIAALAAIASFACHVLLAGPLSATLGLAGLAVATVASQGVHAIILGMSFRARVAPLDGRVFFRGLPQILACAGAAALGAQAYIPLSARIGPSFPRLAALFCAIACAGLAYALVGALLGVPELGEAWRALRKKAK